MFRRLRGAAALAAVTALTLLPGVPAQAVANGEDVPDGRYRFSVSLSMPEITRPNGTTYASACSAALISTQWIISAGHCFHDGARNRINGAPHYPVIATAGQATLSGTGGVRREVVEVVQADDTDVALAKLAEPVPGIRPLRISATAPAEGDVVRLVGWGSADSTADLAHRPDRMQTGRFTVTRHDEHHLYVTGHLPQRSVSACPYDSGAPLFTERGHGRFELVATEVGGPACPHESEETTARADVLRRWVHQHIHRW
ncbi:S1 family peptidase [Prauserella muralis]|uniref:S1 family peptidase n=1 Tax=Prauserella muralis TaxID=588067 RepID=UPI000DD33591|nr:S1 family peptidase [Prauserella muralis]TWE14344.1 trypsin [Prauserella muralis]